jgi:hypothetical protein
MPVVNVQDTLCHEDVGVMVVDCESAVLSRSLMEKVVEVKDLT